MYELSDLIDILSKLPGVGKKSATRIMFHLLKNSDYSHNLIATLSEINANVRQCDTCGQYTIHRTCPICLDPHRDRSKLCIIEEQNDMLAIEETHTYSGLYHILNGAIDPLNGKGPDKLNLSNLQSRIKNDDIHDILIATNPTIEGEATFLYIKNIIENLKPQIKISKLATGIPMGGSLEYSDKLTLAKAIMTRNFL